MSFETLVWVRTAKAGNPIARSVLRVLADHAGQDHSCYLRTALIASETELSESSVRKALGHLIDGGLVRVFERYHKSTGARRTNRYQVLVEGDETPEPDAEDWAGIREAGDKPLRVTEGDPLSHTEGPPLPHGGAPLRDTEGFPIKEVDPKEAPSFKGGASRSKTATRVPDDFAPTDEMKAWFAAENLHQVIHGKTEHEKFMDYWRAAPGVKGRKLDWPATWRNWMRSAAERASRGGYGRPVSAPPGGVVAQYEAGTALMQRGGVPQYAQNSTTNAKVMQTLALAEKFRSQEETR